MGIDRLEARLAQAESELRIYRLYLAEAVVLPPGREILQSWRPPKPLPPPLSPSEEALPPPPIPEKIHFWAR